MGLLKVPKIVKKASKVVKVSYLDNIQALANEKARGLERKIQNDHSGRQKEIGQRGKTSQHHC
jgi:hypothetical protein